MASLRRSAELQLEIRKGYCPDSDSAYVLARCMTMERMVPSDERVGYPKAFP